MTENEMKKYFTQNYNIYRDNAKRYAGFLYETDVIMSNLYLHLYKYIEELKDEKDVNRYSLTYIISLNRWRQNKPLFLTETKKDKLFSDEVYDETGYDLNINFQDLFDQYLDIFIEDYNLTREEEILIRDAFENNLETYKDIMSFYNQRKTYASYINREIKELKQKFKEFLQNKIEE